MSVSSNGTRDGSAVPTDADVSSQQPELTLGISLLRTLIEQNPSESESDLIYESLFAQGLAGWLAYVEIRVNRWNTLAWPVEHPINGMDRVYAITWQFARHYPSQFFETFGHGRWLGELDILLGLGEVRTEGAAQVLASVIAHGDTVERHTAIHALESSASADAIDALTGCLAHADELTRLYAWHSLASNQRLDISDEWRSRGELSSAFRKAPLTDREIGALRESISVK